MKLAFKKPYRSIKSFPEADLPSFSIITGANGTGKTHLLKAIQAGSISLDCIEDASAEVRFFDWNTMIPKDTGEYDGHSVITERMEAWKAIEKLQTLRFEKISPQFASNGMVVNSIEEYKSLFEPGSEPDKIKNFSGIIDLFDRFIAQSGASHLPIAQEVSTLRKKPLSALDRDDFLADETPTWGAAELFQQSFARLFVAYRDLQLKNRVKQLAIIKGRTDVSALSDEEFRDRYMMPPWEFVNSAIETAGLKFRINQPDEFSNTPFEPKLTKENTQTEIKFLDLSSGEKILMSFALCLYYADDKRQLTTYPKILLLDEIDAPLHPAMTKNLIDTIVDTLVEKHKVNVILATHSPSTVALAPEGCLHVMLPDKPGISAISKSNALNLLTVGVPTLALSYDGRRQVFVESPSDAKIYDSLYKLLKTRIQSDRSLEFVATGTRTRGSGDTNTGCEVVRRLVNELTVAGNMSVFGLLDWDGKHNPSERISVIAHGRRNGIENVILDPLLLGIAICRDFPENRAAICIPAEMSYFELITGGQVLFQGMIDAVTTRVFETPPEATSIAQYVGGLSLVMDSRYFTTDDHALEKMIVEAFPFLKGITKNQSGRLIEHVIQNVLGDNPDLIPIEAKAVIEELLERPSHC